MAKSYFLHTTAPKLDLQKHIFIGRTLRYQGHGNWGPNDSPQTVGVQAVSGLPGQLTFIVSCSLPAPLPTEVSV